MQNITRIDYRIQGYKKKKIENNLGDVSTVEFYDDYDSLNDIWTGLNVRETRVFTRQAGTGVPTQLTVDIEWFTSNKAAARYAKQLIKPLSLADGLSANYASRSRLISSAKATALGMMGLANGQAFLAEVSLEINTYKEGNITPLVDAVANSINPNVTQAVKDAIDAIINVTYVP